MKISPKTPLFSLKTLAVGILLSIVVLPSLVSAQFYPTTSTGVNQSQILSLIQSLQTQMATLQQLLAQQNAATQPVAGTCYRFNQDLGVGSISQDVALLHEILAREGITTGGTLPGNTYTFNTATGVTFFQAKYGIRQTGFFGPLTRAKINSIYGCIGTITTPSVTPTYPIYPTTPSQSYAPVNLKTAVSLRQDTNTSAFINAWITGSQQNRSVAQWRLTVQCSQYVSIPNTYGQNTCGQEQSLNGTSISDPTQDYLILSTNITFPAQVYGVLNNSITLTLTAYNSYGQQIGQDSETLYLGTSYQNPGSGQGSIVPTITSLSPNYGPENTVVTVYGRDFRTNARVLFNGTTITPLTISSDGAWLQFRIPNTSLANGSYSVQVANESGQYSSSLLFNLTR